MSDTLELERRKRHIELREAVARAIDSSSASAALAAGPFAGTPTHEQARERAKAEEIALYSAVDRLFSDLCHTEDARDAVVKRAILWEQETVPDEFAERIALTFDAALLRHAPHWKDLTILGVQKMLAQAERRIAEFRPKVGAP